MDNNRKSASWDELLQDLGAKPDESAYERHQPPPREIPSAVELTGASGPVEPAPPAPSDWNSLAASLGIEVEESLRPEPVVETIVTPAVDPPTAELPAAAERVAGTPVAGQPVAEDDFSESHFVEDEVEDAAADYDYDTDADDDYDTDADDDYAADAAADDYEDDKDDKDDKDDESPQRDELPPLPSQCDQALIDTAWVSDEDDETPAAASGTADETAAAATDPLDMGGISGEAARSAFDALFSDGASGWGSAFLDLPRRAVGPESPDKALEDELSELQELAGDPLAAEFDGDRLDRDLEEDPDKPKRKRSRRRRRGGKGRKPAGEQAAGEQAAGDGDSDTRDGGDGGGGRAGGGGHESGVEVSPGRAKQPPRSRSRRGSRPADADEFEAKDKRYRDDLDDDLAADEVSEDEPAEGSDGLERDHPRGAAQGRTRHSNLPTWSEAIGMIVDANLEQRVKSPSKPQSSRSRGGRGGVRRRSGKKPEGK